jgi:hypothetical protein
LIVYSKGCSQRRLEAPWKHYSIVHGLEGGTTYIIGSGKAYCMSTYLLPLKRNGIDLNAIDDDFDRLFPLLRSPYAANYCGREPA